MSDEETVEQKRARAQAAMAWWKGVLKKQIADIPALCSEPLRAMVLGSDTADLEWKGKES